MTPCTTITAHSGCEQTPDDSLESVKAAIACGADLAEVDVRRTSDGALIISHNERESYKGCVTLREVMELIVQSPGVALNCDMKDGSAVEGVLQLAREVGLEAHKLAFSGSVTPAMLHDNTDIVKRAAVYLNVEEVLKELILAGHTPTEREAMQSLRPWTVVDESELPPADYADALADAVKSLGVKALNYPIRLDPDGLYRTLLEKGVPMAVWEVNEPDRVVKLLGEGVRNITTRSVKMALSLRDQHA